MQNPLAMAVLNAVQNPVILVDAEGFIAFANWEAEAFFGASASHLARYRVSTFIPFGSPLLALIDQVRERRAPVNEYRVDLRLPTAWTGQARRSLCRARCQRAGVRCRRLPGTVDG